MRWASVLGTKNEAQLYSIFGLANLVMAKKRLLDLAPQGIGAP